MYWSDVPPAPPGPIYVAQPNVMQTEMGSTPDILCITYTEDADILLKSLPNMGITQHTIYINIVYNTLGVASIE
jgi:hypothetical protein